MSNNIIIFENKKELLRQAHEQSSKVENEHVHSTFLYFIARYFVSLYEGRFGEIPIQVWNEYRNALDHFFRHLTNKNSTHLNKMEGHLQRASLDIMKIYCHKAQERIIQRKSEFRVEVLQLVDNGRFYTRLTSSLNDAEELFVKAKIDDSNLGDDSHTNQEILGKYLDAVFAFDEIYIELLDKIPEMENAKKVYKSIHDNAAKGTFWEHMKTHYLFYISWTVGGGIVQYVYNHGIEETYTNIVKLFP